MFFMNLINVPLVKKYISLESWAKTLLVLEQRSCHVCSEICFYNLS